MEYTKGEWKADGTCVYSLNKRGTNRFFAGIQHGHTDTEEITPQSELEANARLIAAAPNMYEALKELTETELNADILRILSPWFDRVERIIGKAEGR